MNAFSTDFRWRSSNEYDADAFLLEDNTYLLFAYLKADVQDHQKLFAELAIDFEKEYTKKEDSVSIVAGAYKTFQNSKPLEPLVRNTIAFSNFAWAQETVQGNRIFYRLEYRDVLNPGLFLDQKENRGMLFQWCAERKKQALETTLLNLFSYTGAFSLVAAKAGAKTVTSVDVSKRYMNWEKMNFEKNGLEPASTLIQIHRDARDYLKQAVKRGLKFNCVVLDPPTFARNPKPFRAQKEYPRLLENILLCLLPGGRILVSSNDNEWSDFYARMNELAQKHGMKFIRNESKQPLKGTSKTGWIL